MGVMINSKIVKNTETQKEIKKPDFKYCFMLCLLYFAVSRLTNLLTATLVPLDDITSIRAKTGNIS